VKGFLGRKNLDFLGGKSQNQKNHWICDTHFPKFYNNVKFGTK
jgi:hypothetical protein